MSDSDIQRLVERIEAASGPDRVIDGLIWAHIKGDEPYVIGNEPGPFPQKAVMGTRGDLMFVMQNKDIADYIGAPSFSTSIDVAMTLATEGSRIILNIAEDGIATAIVAGTQGCAATPALALCAAALRARITERTDDE